MRLDILKFYKSNWDHMKGKILLFEGGMFFLDFSNRKKKLILNKPFDDIGLNSWLDN